MQMHAFEIEVPEINAEGGTHGLLVQAFSERGVRWMRTVHAQAVLPWAKGGARTDEDDGQYDDDGRSGG